MTAASLPEKIAEVRERLSEIENRPPRKRVRLLKVAVQVVAVVDDGTNLTEAPTNPIEITAADWPNVLELVAEGLADLEARVNEIAPPTKTCDEAHPEHGIFCGPGLQH